MMITIIIIISFKKQNQKCLSITTVQTVTVVRRRAQSILEWLRDVNRTGIN